MRAIIISIFYTGIFLLLLLTDCNLNKAENNGKNNIKEDNLIKTKDTIEYKAFFGYIDSLPVFYVKKTNEIFVLKDNNLKLYKEANPNYEIKFINKNGIIYIQEANDKYCIIAERQNGEEIKINIDNKRPDLTANEECDLIIYSDDFEYLKKIDLNDNKITTTQIKGYSPMIVGDDLFFMNDMYPDDVSATVVLYQTKITDLKNYNEVIFGIYYEPINILPDKKFIICQIDFKGDVLASIYSVDEKKFKILDKIFESYSAYHSFYSFSEQKVIFSNGRNIFDGIRIDLSGEYNYLPKDDRK